MIIQGKLGMYLPYPWAEFQHKKLSVIKRYLDHVGLVAQVKNPASPEEREYRGKDGRVDRLFARVFKVENMWHVHLYHPKVATRVARAKAYKGSNVGARYLRGWLRK